MRWLSLATLAGAGAALARLWGELPARWVTHWGLTGRPDGWAVKSVPAVVTPLVIGFLTWLLIEAAVRRIRSRRAPEALAPELAAIQATVLRAVGLSVALLTAGLSLGLPVLQPRSPVPLLVAALAVVVGVNGVALVWASRQMRRACAAGVAVPEGYRGVVYSNARDARLWVPRLSGLGWTINFAHRLAWPVTIALVGAPLAAAILLSLVGR
jgi:uncharacterized membrane protein